MKKCLLLFTILVIIGSILVSCKNNKPDNNNGNEQGNTEENGDARFFGEGKQFRFVGGEGVELGNEIDVIYKYVREATKRSPYVIGWEDEQTEYEIVFGNSDREVSEKAYHQLDQYYKGKSNESVWAIYVRENSVCFAFDSEQAMNRAIKYFEDNFLNEDFGSVSGVVAYESFDRMEMANEERDAARAEKFEALESKVGSDGVEALKLLYSLYDEGLYTWLANLWCPDVGGFYYSNSGRDTEGFLPDVESTKQALAFLTNSGMVNQYKSAGGVSYSVALLKDYPEIAEKILNFVLSLQGEDGYFYHPQWTDVPSASRLGRDLGSAKGIIAELGGTPNYPYPTDTSADSSDEPMSKVMLTAPLGASSVSSVSKVIATALPGYLQSLEKFAAYVDSLNIDKGSSYSGGNTLVAQKALIKAAGQEYCDYVINYLNEKQYANGTWEKEISYGAISGLMKISGLYESFGVALPRSYEAAESCIIRTIDTSIPESGNYHVTHIYNPWYALAAIIRMSKKTPGVEKEIRELIKEQFAEMVNATYEKINPFQKDDGSFSYYQNESSYTSQGAVVAVPKTNEGDVNATTISSTGLVKWMFACIDSSVVPLYTATDFDLFMETVCDLDSIEKNEAPEPYVITFDDFSYSSDSLEGGIVISPDEMVDVSVRDKDLDGAIYKWVDSQVVDSPAPRGNGDQSLKFSVKSYPCTCSSSPCTCKKLATRASLVYAKTQNGAILGNTFIAELDFYLDSWSSNNIISQLSFSESVSGGTSLSLNLETYTASDGKNYIRIKDNLAGLDGMKNSSIVEGIPVKEWVSLRFELYKTEQLIPDEKTGEIKQYAANVCKIYVNGEYVGESDASDINDDGTTVSKHVNAFVVSGYRHLSSTVYLDNVRVYRTTTDYVCEEEDGNGVLANMAVDKSETVARFENGRTATYYLKNLTVPGYIKYSIKDIAGRTALVVEKHAMHPSAQTYTQAALSNPDDVGECYTFESKIYYDSSKMVSGRYVTQLSINASSSLSFIGFNLKFYGSYVEVQHNENYLNGSDIESKGVVKGVDGKSLHLPVDEWFMFRLEFYRAEVSSESVCKIFIGDGNGENMTLRAELVATKTDRTDPITRFLFTHYRANDALFVALDDVSFVRSDKEFVSGLPDEHKESFDNGYTSGEMRISDNTADPSYSGKDKVSASSDPENVANNVLKIVSSADSDTPYLVSVKHSASQITNGRSALEFKLYVNSCAYGGFATIAFAGTGGNVQEITLNKGADGRVFLAIPDGYTVTENELTEANARNRLELCKWNTIKMELVNSSDSEKAYLEVFINGECVGRFVGYKSLLNVHTVTISGTAEALMYLDDVSYREFLLPKEPLSGVGADELTTITGGENFDSLSEGLIGDGTDSNVSFGQNNAYNPTKTQPDDTIIVTDDPTGADNKVLMFCDGARSDHSTLWIATSSDKYKANGDKYVVSVFETKLFIEKPLDGSGSTLAQLIFTTGRTTRITINLTAAKTNGEFTHAYFSLTGSGKKLEFNQWYTVRIEYHNVAEGSDMKPYAEIFVNGESIGSKDVVNSKGEADYNDVDSFFWKSFSSGQTTFYFDNISYTERQADYVG